jgi:hypothetical protein
LSRKFLFFFYKIFDDLLIIMNNSTNNLKIIKIISRYLDNLTTTTKTSTSRRHTIEVVMLRPKIISAPEWKPSPMIRTLLYSLLSRANSIVKVIVML